MPNPLDHLYDQLKVKYPDFVDRGEFVSKLSNEDELKKLHQAATQSFKGFVGFDDFKNKVGESLSTYDQDSDYKTQDAASTGQENAETVNPPSQQEESQQAPSEPQNSGIESEASVPDGPTDTSADAEAFDRETGDLDELGRRYDEKIKRLEGYGATEGLYANEEAARKHYEAYTRLLDEAEQDRLAYNRRVKAAEDERAEQQRQLDMQSKDRKKRRTAEYAGYTNDEVRKEQDRLKKERAYLEDPKSRRNADYSKRVAEYNADQTALSGEADKRNKSYERKRAMYEEVKTIAEDPDVQKRITGNDMVSYVLSGNNTYATQNYDAYLRGAKMKSVEELADTCKTIAGQVYARGDNKDVYAPLASCFMANYYELMYRMGGDEPKSAMEMRYDMIDKATEGTPEGDNFMLGLRNYLDGTAGMGTQNYETDDSERANIPQFAVVDNYKNLVSAKKQENTQKVAELSRLPQVGYSGSGTILDGRDMQIFAAAADINYDDILQQAFDEFGEDKLKEYIVAHSLRNGISTGESARRVYQYIWNETIGKEIEESRPKSGAEFFMRRITSDNMFGKLIQLGIRGYNGNLVGTDPFAINSMVLDEYAKDHPGWDTAAVVTNFAVMEGPIFSGYGKIASGLVGAGERAIIGAATKTAERTAIESTARTLSQSLVYRLAKGGATGALVGFQYGTMSGTIDQAYYNGDVDFGKVIANGGHMMRDFALMHGVGEVFGVTGDAILRRGQRNLRNGQGKFLNRIETASLHFLNNVAKTTTNAAVVTGLYAAIDKPALERENKKIEAENKKIEAENARLPEDKQKPLKPLNQIASVEDTFYSSLRMFAGLDAVGMLRSAWSIGVRGQYERNKHVKIHFDKFDREALEKAFGKNPNSLLRQIVFGNVDGVPAKWFEIDPEAEQEIYKELGRELTPAEKEAYATYGFTELRKVILNKDIPWATRAKIVSVITGRVVQEPPVAKATIDFVMDSSGTMAKRIIVKSIDLEGNVIQAREFDGQREFEAARSLYEALNDRGWRNNAMLCGNLVIDAIEDKTYADTVDEMAREKGIAPEQFEQMVFGIKQKDITGEKVTYQERQLVDEFDKRHQEKQDTEIKLTGPDKLFEQVAREVFGAEWKQAKNIPFKSWGEMTEAEKEFVGKYIERMGAMGVAERNKLMNANPDWVRTAKEYEESVRRRMEEAERPAEAEPLPALEDEKVSVEVSKDEEVEPVPEVIELEEEKPAEPEPVKEETPAEEPVAEEKPDTEGQPQAGTIGFEPVEQPTERERFDAERKEKAATITDADIEANREALGIPEGTALTDEARQIYAEDLAEDLMRYERFKRGESDEKARFHDYWESKFNPKRPKLEKPIEKQEEPEEEEFEEEEVTEADALIEQFDNLKGRSDLERYRNALKVFAGDDEIMAILEDLEPHDITEWVSSFLGLDSGKGYSMLWESKTRGGTVIAKGFKEETGWSWNDVKGFAFMFDNKNGMSPRRVAEKIWEELPSGIKDRYSDVDVFNIMMDLFGQSSRKSDLTGYIRNNRMEQVRELLNRRRNNELDEIARYKERERRGDEEPVAPPVSDDEEQNEFTVREDEVAPFSLLSLSYRDEEVESGTIRSRARARKQLGTIAKALGYKIRWVADKPYNAKIDTDEKVLSVNIRTDRPLESVIGHEITHDLRKSDPEAYEALKRYAQDMLGEEQWDDEVKDVTDTYNEEYKRRGWEPIRADKAEEEVVCDTMGKVLHTRKGLRELAGSLDPGVAGKVYRLLKDITDKVKSALGKEHDYSTMDLALRDFLNAVKQRAKNNAPINDAPIEDDFDIDFSLRRKPAPKNTGIGYKVFFLKDGKLYPPMVANIGGEATPFGVWLDADAAPIAGKSKTGRNKVKAGGKGTQGGSGTLAYRPGWHLGKIPYALQFNRGKKVPNPLGILNKKGQVIEVGEFFPNDFVWAEVEYAADKDYQKEAHGYGVNANGKYNPSLAGLPRVPEDGSYEYRTNPNPATDPWIITGAMKVNKILKPSEVDEMVRAAGREPQKRQEGAFTDEQIDALNKQLSNQANDAQQGIHRDPSGGYSVTDKADIESLAPRMDGESEAAYSERIAEIGADEKAFVEGDGQFSLKREDTMRDNSVKYFEEYHVRGNKDRKYGPLRRNSITRQALDKANEMIAEMRDYIAPWYDRVAGGNRYLPEEVYGLSTIFDNASYGATLENTLICTRTLAYNDFCDSVKRKLGRPLTKRESFLASQMLYDIATDPQCLYCYVSLDRKAYDEYLLRYFDERDAVIERYNKMADKSAENIDALYKTFLDGRKDTYQMRSRFNSWLMLADHDSAIGRDKVALSSDRKNALAQESNDEAAVRWREINKQYNRLRGEEKKKFKQSKEYLDALHNYLATEQGQIKDACAYAQGASWAKKEAEYRSYTGELLKTTKRMLGGLASHYGLRFYSFSEYSPAFILENMQMVRDAALRGLKGFAYTKEIDFCKIFLPTGININCSTYGRRNAAGEIVMDERQGANWDEARALRDQYENMGIVFVATDDEMVRWAKEQPWIDVIIPFHIVRTGADIAEFYGWTNYTNVSADYDAQGRHKDIMPPEHNNSIEEYDRLIAERGLTRRFPQFYDGPGDQNYMKLINETRRKASDTPILTPVFNMEEAKKSFDKFVEKGGYWGGFYEVGADDVVRAVDEVAADIEAGKSAGEVEYGRQDIDFDSAMSNLEKTRRRINRNREHGNTPKTSFSLKARRMEEDKPSDHRARRERPYDLYRSDSPAAELMVSLLNPNKGDRILEPSAGKGDIIDFVGEDNPVTAVEINPLLIPALKEKVGGGEVVNEDFLNHDGERKYPRIVMNPPFGDGGKLAIQHTEAAFSHLENGGRLVAIIPSGKEAAVLFNEMMGRIEQQGAHLAMRIDMPSSLFNKQNARLKTSVVVIDRNGESSVPVIEDLSSIKDKDELYNRFDDISRQYGSGLNLDNGQFSLKRDDRNAPTFYSNAAKAVENVKQNKATAEQWKAMLTKAGGIKAGEDKWMGLSTWLDEHKGQTLTKEEVAQFVADNGIEMREVNYEEHPSQRTNTADFFMFTVGLTNELIDLHKTKNLSAEEAFQDIIERYGPEALDYVHLEDPGLIRPNKYIDEKEALAFFGQQVKEDEIFPIDSTRLDYTTDGLENKREIAFVVPDIEPYQEHDEIHFGPENQGRAVMWVRFGETTDTEGNRVLVIDEVQSNRHQDAREKGYKVDEKTAYAEYRKAISDYREAEKSGNKDAMKDAEKRYEYYGAISGQLPGSRESYQGILKGAIPAAPFEKNWHEVAMKRMLRLAAEGGYAKLAWTTGGQQARRYDLGQSVKSIEKTSVKNDKGAVRYNMYDHDGWGRGVFVKDGIVTDSYYDFLKDKPLTEVVGKEIAEKMMSLKDGESIQGDDLMVGGEGMKAFYDGILPQFMNKYGKRWGVKVGEVTLNTPGRETMHSVDVNEDMKRSVMQGQPLFSLKRDKGNLDERQEREVKTKNFKNWFGDWENDPENASKVVDKDGKPLVVYHQTNAKRWINRDTGEDWEKLDWRKKMEWENRSQEEWEDAWEEQDFYTFDDRYARQSIEMPAIFFSPENDPHHEYGERTIAAYLDIKNPAINPDIPNRGVTDTAGRDAMEALKAQGYDGFIRTDEDGNIREYGVFDSNQVKSADENNGDFDPNNPDIRFSLKRETRTDADGNEVYTETREDGTKDREITTYQDGSKKALWYDNKGNLKERLDYFPNGEVSQVANYDSGGNLTRHIQYDENRRTTSYYLPAIGTDWKLDENGIARGKSNGVEIKPYNFQFSLKTYHGSGADFDRFNHDYVGSGEGNQAYGWGTYVTEVEGIGRRYAMIDYRRDGSRNHFLYSVEIPDEKEGKYLPYGERVSDPKVRKVLTDRLQQMADEYWNGEIPSYKLTELDKALNTFMPRDIASVLECSDKEVSQLLSKAGYTGVKYVANVFNRGQKGLSYNYVIFNEKDLGITDKEQFSLKRRRNRDDYTDEDRADAAIIANTYLAQADALRQQIEADRQREHQLVEERNKLLAFDYPAADPADRPAIMDRINSLRNQINDLRNANYENNTKLRSMDYEYRVAKEILEQGAVTDEEAARFDAGQMTREEKVLESLFKAAADSRADKKAKQKAIRGLVRELAAITDNFKAAMKARGIESQRKHYDKGTVDHIIRLARAMMGTGYIDNMTSYEVKRLMGMINNAATRESIETQAGRIVDMMLDHQIRTLRNDFNKQLKVTGQKTNSSGVQVQAGLDQEGQVVMEAMRKSMQIIADSAGERYDSNGNITEWGEFYEKTLNDMGDEDPVKAEQARKIFEGVWLASKWYEDVRTMEINGRILRSQMEDFKASNKPAKDADADTKQRYADVLADYQEMLRQNKIKIIEAYERMTGDVGMTQADSIRRAKEFADAQKQRVNEIQHNANSDLADVDDNTQVETPESRVFGANKNNVLARLLFASAGTYEKFMRFFGRMAPNGEGYLFKRFMTQYHHARQDYWKGRHSAFEEMDKKMAEVFGKKKMHWSDIYEMTRDHKKFPPITVSYWDGYRNGQPFLRVDELNQSEALYLYMINKMPDGRMKLRHMGITDDVVQQMADQINYKLITLADWLQSEFLPKMRIKYNETHKRVFGADMAAIEDYFPLRINKLAVASDMDITERDMNDNKPSTITGAIVKRRVNTLPIDLHTDAFDVALSHIDEMEHWSAFAEFNRDNNTLVNYKRFRTKVNNMRSLELGAGNVLWKNFTDAVAIAADAYHPRAGSRSGDHYSTRVAKFVSTAKIALRPYTALKQLLSIPAFWADSDPLEQMKATVNVANTWQWAIENLPGFAERWQSRQAGNIKLANYNDLSGLRRRKAMRKLQRAGMWANAAIDGLACAMGGKAVYETKLKRYRKMGYDEARAQEKALIDAAIAYNNSQQSSEGAYVSPLQVDRTWFANAFSVFRSASMGYTRRLNTSLRQLRNATFKPGYGVQSVEFLKKQMMRDGLTEEQAEKWAHRIYRRANLKAAASVAIFGQILPFTWNLGTNMFYLLFGDDDKEKKKILADSFRHSFFGPIEGLVGGNVYSELGDIAADTAIGNIWGDSIWGDSNAFKALGYRDFSTMPLSSDINNVLKYFARDEVKAANEVVNILFQVATGVNPQTITDWVTAILDFSRSDMERRDIAMFAMRLLSTPQQQLDKFYLDEMNLTKEQAGKMSVDDLIKRYATYKRWRETPLTGWMYSDEREKKVEEKFQKRYEEMLEERSVAEDGLRGTINDMKDLPRKRTMMQKLQKELTDSIEAADPELYKKALEGEKADDDEYVRHVTDKDVEQMAELTMKKKALRAARDRKVQADKDAEAGRITQEEYDAIYKECAHQWKLYNYLNNTLPKKLKEWKLKMEPDMQDKYTPEQIMDIIRSKTDKALQMRPEDMKLKKGDKKKVKKNKKK